jgi:hypothetical protein
MARACSRYDETNKWEMGRLGAEVRGEGQIS